MFTVYVGDKLVQPETKLSECTSGACGLLVCSVSAPEDNCAHGVGERVHVRASELTGEVTKDAFFQRHGFHWFSAGVIGTNQVACETSLKRACHHVQCTFIHHSVS